MLCRRLRRSGNISGCIVHYSSAQSLKLVLIRCLTIIEPDDGNLHVVQEFGNKRYSYCVSPTGYIHTTLMLSAGLPRPIILVLDPYWFKVAHVLNQWFDDISADDSLQTTLRFWVF